MVGRSFPSAWTAPCLFNKSHHKIPKIRYRVMNWPDYDVALCDWVA